MTTAAAIAIGDELLSGRTRDSNLHHLAGWLTERGVALREARIVADDEAAIVAAIRALAPKHAYVFTCGGIGPTHDDITADAVAKAFDAPIGENPDALKALEDWYAARDEDVTPARRRMARTPEGARLIDNPESGAPGFQIQNVFVMAGVPRIFTAMLDGIDDRIERGARLCSFALTAEGLPESRLAEQLRALQSALYGVTIGSYPFDGDVKGVTVVVRSENEMLARQAADGVAAAMRALGVEPVAGDHKG